jgi:hypothetical protein
MWVQLQLFLPLSQPHALGEWARLNLISANVICTTTHPDRYGLVGLLRPLTVYPSEMVYWGVSLSNNF